MTNKCAKQLLLVVYYMQPEAVLVLDLKNGVLYKHYVFKKIFVLCIKH